MDICLSPARAAASRANGAKSRGPKTPEGKARSAQNALKHGMRAQKCVVLPGERASAYEAFEAALLEELAPEGALQAVLAQRVVAASWRLARAERLEAELFAQNMFDGRGLGLALVRECNGARARSTRSCAIAAARSPSCGARCAPSKASRPRRRRPPRRPHRVCSASRRTCRSNPSAAEILAIQLDRAIECTLERLIRGRRPRGCRTVRCPRPAKRRAFSRSNPSGARSRHKRPHQRLRAGG